MTARNIRRFSGTGHLTLRLFAVACAIFWTGCGPSKQQIDQFQQEHAELLDLRAKAAESEKAQSNDSELARLKQENQEVHRLRNEVHELRAQVEQAKAAPVRPATPTASAAGAVNQEHFDVILAENQRLRDEIASTRQVAASTACLNNLRQMDGAIEQWALENKKPSGTVLGPADVQAVSAYIKGGRIPACPQGGTYSITSVGTPPTCSVPGHAL